MRNKLFFLVLCLSLFVALGVRAEEDPEEFVAKKDTRIYRIISPGQRLKNGKRPIVSFIFPEGFKTDYCGEATKNKKGEVYCNGTEGEFTFTKEVTDSSGRKIILSMYADAGRSEKEIKDQKERSKRNVVAQFKNQAVIEKVSEGEFPPSMGIDGYYGTYISASRITGRHMERIMVQSVGKCAFFTVYSEYPVGDDKEPIKVESWMHGDLQEMVQKSFRCEELGSSDFSKFK